LSRRHTGLPRDSIASASQIATLNKDDLESLVGTLPRRLLDQVDEGVRWFLALDR
jgi:mRNA-degrading endonuclease toxin of MazEF toxin-antitoxin module